MNTAFRWWGDLATRLRVAPTFSQRPDRGLVDLVEGPAALAQGRALDIGCGTGRNGLYLARHGWEVTGVDLLPSMVESARATAEREELTARFEVGDVTRLDGLDLEVDGGFGLLVDGGCLHMIPRDRRDAYVSSIESVAAPDALLLLFGFARHPMRGGGVTADELRERFGGWELTAADRLPGEEVRDYVDGPAFVRTILERQWLTAWRYLLRRSGPAQRS